MFDNPTKGEKTAGYGLIPAVFVKSLGIILQPLLPHPTLVSRYALYRLP